MNLRNAILSNKKGMEKLRLGLKKSEPPRFPAAPHIEAALTALKPMAAVLLDESIKAYRTITGVKDACRICSALRIKHAKHSC